MSMPTLSAMKMNAASAQLRAPAGRPFNPLPPRTRCVRRAAAARAEQGQGEATNASDSRRGFVLSAVLALAASPGA